MAQRVCISGVYLLLFMTLHATSSFICQDNSFIDGSVVQVCV